MSKVEFCYVDKKGVHNKLYENGETLKKDIEIVERLVPNVAIRLLGKDKKTGKPLTVYRGSGEKFAWDKTSLVVEVILVDNGKPVVDKDGNPILFTYITKKYVDMASQFPVRTARGTRTAIVSSPCWRKTENETNELATALGYSKLVVLQDVIVKEG